MTLNEWISLTGIKEDCFASRVGISQPSLNRYRRGQRMPPDEVQERIAEATGGAVRPQDWANEGIQRRRRNVIWTPEMRSRLLIGIQRGETATRLAKAVGVDPSALVTGLISLIREIPPAAIPQTKDSPCDAPGPSSR